MNDKTASDFARRISTDAKEDAAPKLVPAATVILLRDSAGEMQTLMLRKNSKIAFGGMWVFPGGRIDDDDAPGTDDMEQRARVAACREALEETALVLQPEELTWISHWTPPPMGNRRFTTWFFASPAPEGDVQIDDGEIIESMWVSPQEAIAQQAAGDIELAPPTFVTLHYLSQHSTVDAAMAVLRPLEPRYYSTRIKQSGDSLVALWEGDAAYDSDDVDAPGKRHRLLMKSGGFAFEDSGAR